MMFVVNYHMPSFPRVDILGASPRLNRIFTNPEFFQTCQKSDHFFGCPRSDPQNTDLWITTLKDAWLILYTHMVFQLLECCLVMCALPFAAAAATAAAGAAAAATAVTQQQQCG